MWLGASLGMKSNHVFDLKVTIFINHKVKLQILTPQFAVFFLSNLMSILCPESRVRSSWSDLPFGGGGHVSDSGHLFSQSELSGPEKPRLFIHVR